MTDLQQLLSKIEEWERMSIQTPNSYQRERWLNKASAAPPTPSQHFIPMYQEINRLREALREAVYELKLAHNFFKKQENKNALTLCS